MRAWLLMLALLPVIGHAGDGQANAGYVEIPAGKIRSVLKYEDTGGTQTVNRFALMRQPVSNEQFLAFVKSHASWQRGRVPASFAETAHYLVNWAGPTTLGRSVLPRQPVVQASWFAASAYCEAQGARLPTWAEWEYVSAADPTRRDARSDPHWRESILAWYAKPSNAALPLIGQTPANVYGIQDMHGLVWEWTADYSAMLVSADNRSQSEPDRLKFCGASAISMEDKENYAVLMRVAMLSALEANNSTSNLGFRCAKDLP